ncbi:MAG: UDP-2,3-diacylglucosamine diphosphatase, partial [candidate division WOR-3 bacterium]
FLLGDIFDFYFEYKSFIPKAFFNIFLELKNTVEKGINIHYWVGNHDFWIGDFIEKLGIVKHKGAEIVKIGKKKFLVQHGDEMDGIFIAKRFLARRFSRILYSLIHPELGLQMAKSLSRFSQSRSGTFNIKEEYLVKLAVSRFSEGIDGVIMGHFHKPYFYREKRGTLALIGDWKHDRSYGSIVNGNISVMRFNQSPR